MPPKPSEEKKNLKSPQEIYVEEKMEEFNRLSAPLKEGVNNCTIGKEELKNRLEELKEMLQDEEITISQAKEKIERGLAAEELRAKNIRAELNYLRRRRYSTTIGPRNLAAYDETLDMAKRLKDESEETLKLAASNEPDNISYKAQIKKMEAQLGAIVITKKIDLSKKEEDEIRAKISREKWLELTEPAWKEFEENHDNFLKENGLPPIVVNHGWLAKAREKKKQREALGAQGAALDSSQSCGDTSAAVEDTSMAEAEAEAEAAPADQENWEAYNRISFYDD
ncbi:hypothetical protein NHQ30_009452 [Ciborinia camelliae]|nr:hypothetical protein NHQ30_009452 [Ciborinia camelliae]